MTKQKPTSIEIAEVKLEMDKPRIAASALGLTGYECSGCGCRFPETRAPMGRESANTPTGKDSRKEGVRPTRL
jgi:hypothetical protein